MSILIQKKRRNPGAAPSVGEIRVAPLEAEAPDRGQQEMFREAPESRPSGRVEAPDAGVGRASHVEHEFTRGRSQS